MYLRFDKNQIRIRVLQAEGAQLLNHETLTEAYAFSPSAEPIQLEVESSGGEFSFKADGSFLKVKVPRDILLKTFESPARAPICVLKTNLGGASTEILFEVDAFKKREESKR